MSSREAWQRRLGPLYGGAVALVHSTPWPWPTEVGDEPRSAGWVVALGAPIGVLAWIVAMLARGAGIPAVIAAITGLAGLSLASAALVERGLAEQIDHWEGHARTPGVAAVLALVFTTMIRAAAIAWVPPAHWLLVFMATAIVGRWAAIFLQALGDPIRHDEARRSLVAIPAPAWLTAAVSLGVVVITVIALGKAGIAALALIALATFGLGLHSQRSAGGLTPPIVAVAAAVGELVILLVATI